MLDRRGFMFGAALTLLLPGAVSAHAFAARRPRAHALASLTDRLAVLSPALAVVLRDLGIGDLMIARHGFDVWSDQSLPVVGDQAGIDYEALLRADPTSVLLEWGRRELPARLTELGKTRAWDIINCSTLSLDDIRQTTRRLWSFTPESRMSEDRDRAWEEADIHARMKRAWSRREPPPNIERIGNVLLVISTEPTLGALGPGSAHAEILTLVGGRPELADGLPYQELDAEDLLRRNPGGIILIKPRPPGHSKEPRPDPLAPLRGRGLAAERDGRLAVIDDPLALIPSTSLIGFADSLSEILSRWSADAADPAPDNP